MQVAKSSSELQKKHEMSAPVEYAITTCQILPPPKHIILNDTQQQLIYKYYKINGSNSRIQNKYSNFLEDKNGKKLNSMQHLKAFFIQCKYFSFMNRNKNTHIKYIPANTEEK